MDLQQVKVKIKKWEYEFIEKNNRPPDRDDIRNLSEVKKLYKLYSSLKKRQSVATPRKEDYDDSKVDPTPEKVAKNVVLGPTPQIYGKAISIFEMKVSPLKTVEETPTTEVEESDENDEFKESESEFASEEAGQAHGIQSIKKRLFDSVEADLMTNVPELNITESDTEERTRVTSDEETNGETRIPTNQANLTVPNITRYGPNSPLKLAQSLSIRHKLLTPRKLQKQKDEKSMFSPSPLLKKNTSKSLFELANEHKRYVEEVKQLDLEFKGQIVPIRNLTTTEAEEEKDYRKQKRRTGVLRRLKFDEPEDSTEKQKDIHKELHKLKAQKLNEYMGNEEEHISSDEEKKQNAPAPAPQKRKRPKKFNLVSNNFRRLKLPKKNRNPRFRRR
ncbi:DNA replication regulator SLD2 [Nakaseomyces bracarensis]|uniref:DNA replication regulator SLD2 n=1 Tax=Nakaseomyces bracarensis TaxID=273131 RepID=A0ABR4NVJ8_9SACH